MKIKNILILAGGDSTRFWPLKNKILYSFLGKSLIQHVIEMLNKYTEHILVVTSKSNLEPIQLIDKKVHVIQQENPEKGMADAVLSARSHLNGDLLIVNANDIFNPTIIDQLLEKKSESHSELTFVAKKMKSYFPGGYLKFDINGKLESIIEKPAHDKTPSDLVNLVVDYFSDAKKWVNTLERIHIQSDDAYELALTKFLNVFKTEYVVYDDFWFTLKYPWHVLPMMGHYLTQLSKEVKVGKNVKIAETAKIEGPCFIDDNSIIGDFALVRQSHIGKNCLIGGYSEVTRSYLGNNVSLHRNYVGDSVLADNVLMGAGVVTANFRFDKKSVKSLVAGAKVDTQLSKLGAIIGADAKIGVNSTLYPGIKIGSGTFIAPAHTIVEDVENAKFVRRKIVPNLHNK